MGHETIQEESVLVSRAICLLDKVEHLIKEKITAIDSMIMFFDFLPLPAWVNDISGRPVAINDACKKIYPVALAANNEFVFGFPEIVLNQYLVNDLWVQNYKMARVFEEPAPVEGQPNRVSKILKFPVFSNSGELVGVAGVELTLAKENT